MSEVLQRVTAEVEKRKLESALRDAAGNRTRAADLLQIGFKQFALKLREHGLDATT
jgi:DNA-binding NtrC family response regulator